MQPKARWGRAIALSLGLLAFVILVSCGNPPRVVAPIERAFPWCMQVTHQHRGVAKICFPTRSRCEPISEMARTARAGLVGFLSATECRYVTSARRSLAGEWLPLELAHDGLLVHSPTIAEVYSHVKP